MKKLCRFLLPILVLSTSLVSCGNDKENESEKVAISFGAIHGEEVKHIPMEYFQDIVDAKDNFLFVVSSNTCTCWQEFKPIVEKYTKENNLVCYEMSYNDMKDYAHMYDLAISSGTTTFAIFENGIKKYTLKSGDSEVMEDYDKFKNFMDASIIKPKAFYINENDIASIKASDKAAVIYYERTNCGDCSYINRTMLRDYISSHNNMNKLYVIDCRDWWKSSKDPEYQTYLNTKANYGLAAEKNPTYGYDAGVFPYFSLIENGNYTSGAVVFNDELENIEGNYVVSNSYYTTERIANLSYTTTVIKGMSVPASDVSEYGSWKQEAAEKVYKPILNSFLDFALAKVTYTF